MKNIYFYGASDDCHEIDTDYGKSWESYTGFKLKYLDKETDVDYTYDGDFSIFISETGTLPASWKWKFIKGNANRGYSQFVHLQIPDIDAKEINFVEIKDCEEE